MDSGDMNCIDLISSLPDDILCLILSRVPTKDAVATSVLATRWKHLPPLIPNVDVSDYAVGTRSLSNSLPEDLIVAARGDFMQYMVKVLTTRSLPNKCDADGVTRRVSHAHYYVHMITAEKMFVQFVWNVILERVSPNRRNIPTFRLRCTYVYDQSIIANWILLVLQLNVQELDLLVMLNASCTLPCEIFQCETLEVLKLGSRFHLEVPESANLPKLKELDLEFVEFVGEDSIRILLSSCPMLEDLRLFFCRFRGSKNIEIAHPLLKKLVLAHNYDEYYVIFDTPNLQNLFYNMYGNCSYLVKNFESLAHAHIDWVSAIRQFRQIEDDNYNLVFNRVQRCRFINEMHKVRFLALDGSSITALYSSECELATFQNLTVMALGCSHISGWPMLPAILAKSPNLEVLVFPEGFIKGDTPKRKVKFSKPDTIPLCFSRSLKEIKVMKFDGLRCELELLKYFLYNVQALKTVMIGPQAHSKSPFGFAVGEIRRDGRKEPPVWVKFTRNKLLTAPKRSKDCQITISWEEGSEVYRNIILK